MNSPVKQLKLNIAASIYMIPCTEEDLVKREFLKNYSLESIQRLVFVLEKDGAIYYKGDIMYVYRSYARKNLREYELG